MYLVVNYKCLGFDIGGGCQMIEVLCPTNNIQLTVNYYFITLLLHQYISFYIQSINFSYKMYLR